MVAWRYLLGLTLLCCCCAHIAQAQQPVVPFQPSKDNLNRMRWLQYKMVGGRVRATSVYPEGMNISYGPTQIANRLRERLQLTILKERASVRYELTGDGQELSIHLTEEGDLTLRRASAQPKLEIGYRQQAGEPIVLTIRRDNTERIYPANSFWHLYLAEPGLVQEHLIPLIEMLRPAWQLSAMGADLERALLAQAQQPRKSEAQQWGQLVADLGSPKFPVRAAAQRELQRAGQAVLPYLQALDREQLDAEQLARVRELVDQLSVEYEDTAQRVAVWLANDPAAWLALMARPEEAKRRAAAAQLESLVGKRLEFDPQSDETARHAQLERLRARLTPARPLPAAQADPAESVPPPGGER